MIWLADIFLYPVFIVANEFSLKAKLYFERFLNSMGWLLQGSVSLLRDRKLKLSINSKMNKFSQKNSNELFHNNLYFSLKNQIKLLSMNSKGIRYLSSSKRTNWNSSKKFIKCSYLSKIFYVSWRPVCKFVMVFSSFTSVCF